MLELRVPLRVINKTDKFKGLEAKVISIVLSSQSQLYRERHNFTITVTRVMRPRATTFVDDNEDAICILNKTRLKERKEE